MRAGGLREENVPCRVWSFIEEEGVGRVLGSKGEIQRRGRRGGRRGKREEKEEEWGGERKREREMPLQKNGRERGKERDPLALVGTVWEWAELVFSKRPPPPA